MPEPERRSHPDPRPRRRWSARGVPTGRREPCAVLRGVRQRVPAARSAWRRADRIPGSPGGLSLRSESSNSPAECVARVKVFRGLDVIAAEYKATDQVPIEARKFTGWDQFTLWFAAASLPAAWLYGGYMTGASGPPGAFALLFPPSATTFIPSALSASTAGHRAIRYLNWASTVALVGLGAYASYIVLKDFDFGQLWAWRPTRPLSFTFTAGALGNGFTYTLTLPLLLDLLIAYNWTWEF